ncbi:MAG: hypothetical protein A3B91_02195 [Candidatus Yanofskybacteria bacterium RIFCSPHIGHO2_02_FULL_41_29]|uniref:GP-PDE domain-containing protein n=1 Tax=Candidatus Yanofskybacteria bacterium RIFCSPHIGHO2_01_FULL_41_53 TaxID=1802663 RepID=A0A1F8EG07_9BACT|nr:MAG: hypothetical protein A2650_04930 [Candidatus Yanofskybacteria bacterium RIFCSPHIGHO2_01_FULL_41_53]OGN12336.1 MAG: hypothetical protein A3B91_02195 [Candidatus Yanofskybacteria bacterium RIFCSPHIGHO2_02_FULL_41_29]OGN17705.1 MAG: hypothetical protein A3F48_00500 [Candidatus Yanofskybacteria bacterium RIFCSPHIGHO2_12_FULL_41_9]OGN22011.1 MAG: hypothetical protein A2916_04270 [Candidatus Yanofskybacteria bacterium RIFCSPLOWO2_01_FULL_41_67]OGN28901.1 MAG: hypothetical protein A3H54_02030 
MEVISHRGRTSPHELGNSLRSFISAYNLGVTGIETDISFTADKRIIIYHPDSTKPNLADMKWRDIDKSVFKVMQLNDFLSLLKSFSDTFCCLDIKQNSEELVKKAVEMVLDKGLQNRIYFTAFEKKARWITIESHAGLLLLAKKIYPKTKIQIITTTSWNLLEVADKYNPDAMSIGWLLEPLPVRLITKSLFKAKVRTLNFKKQISEIQRRGTKIWAGIFNDPEDMNYFVDLGVDGIFTDSPGTVFELIEKKKIP